MTQSAFNWVQLALLIFLIGFITLNSCNDTPQEQDTSKLLELVNSHLKTSDSLYKAAIDSLLAISARDSANSVTINNIFNNGKQTKQEIIKKPFNSGYVNGIRNLLDSVYSANNK